MYFIRSYFLKDIKFAWFVFREKNIIIKNSGGWLVVVLCYAKTHTQKKYEMVKTSFLLWIPALIWLKILVHEFFFDICR